jgi:hypothetical protein
MTRLKSVQNIKVQNLVGTWLGCDFWFKKQIHCGKILVIVLFFREVEGGFSFQMFQVENTELVRM